MDSSAHLLIVDDDREIRDLLSRFLRRQGFRVDTARDGREMHQARKALGDGAGQGRRPSRGKRLFPLKVEHVVLTQTPRREANRMTARRDFLKKGGAATAGAVAATTPAA